MRLAFMKRDRGGRLKSGDLHIVEIQNLGYLHELGCIVPDTESEMMSRAFGYPTLEESAHVGFEDTVSIGVASSRNRAPSRFALGDDEFELPVCVLADTEHSDRTFLNPELDTGAETGLPIGISPNCE